MGVEETSSVVFVPLNAPPERGAPCIFFIFPTVRKVYGRDVCRDVFFFLKHYVQTG